MTNLEEYIDEIIQNLPDDLIKQCMLDDDVICDPETCYDDYATLEMYKDEIAENLACDFIEKYVFGCDVCNAENCDDCAGMVAVWLDEEAD